MGALCQILVIFAEPGFPVMDVAAELPVIDGAIVARSVVELESALQADCVLVWRHGSTFPAEAWPEFLRFLERGGSFVYLGGQPFTRPVSGAPGSRVVQPRTVALLKQLRLNQCYRINAGGAMVKYADIQGRRLPDYRLPQDTQVAILEPRLSDTKDFASEDGAAGSRDAVVLPLAHVYLPDEDPRFPAAAASLTVSRLRGRFAGGQWVFHLLSTRPRGQELELLLEQARRPVVHLRVDPTYGCFHEGERPTVVLRVDRPGAKDVLRMAVDLEVRDADGGVWKLDDVPVAAGAHAAVSVPLDIEQRPGLYRVTARATGLSPATTGLSPASTGLSPACTGFWIFDPQLFRSGAALSFDAYTLRRNGKPEPVVGTTVMSGSVHRKFLFEPNAARWDDTFAELASLNVNLVRTGVWSAYRKISLDPNVVDEAWLRALEAYYLSARRHGVAVLFTFFSFIPEAFGGLNPYLDPRALEGQAAYVSAVASRFAEAREIIWDLINEPSFCSPEKLWFCRPNGDRFDRQAFLKWLEQRFDGDTAALPGGRPALPGGWESVVRSRWRLAPGEEIGLPADEDFEDGQLMGDRRPYRAMDYSHFAQDAFEVWIGDLTRAIRQAASPAAITVGQDEGGLRRRPNPLFHYRSVDFTSMHTWWLNDVLLWDGVLAKAPGKPLLISETGIMQRELLSGEALRDPQDSARLLSRKIGLAFAGGAFGVVQWCYDVNPYMAIDNEAAIGLRRVDGSYKPEHKVWREFASFVARNKTAFESPRSPEVVLIVPSANQFSPRDAQTAATQRVVAVLVDRLGIPVQAVSEYRTRHGLGRPKLIVLPSCRGICDAAWSDIMAAVEQGATLHCSGWFETDDAGLPAERVGGARRRLALVEVVQDAGAFSGQRLRYPRSAAESAYTTDHDQMPRRLPHGQGTILHYSLPIEWAQEHELQERIYAHSLQVAGVTGGQAGVAGEQASVAGAVLPSGQPGVLLRCIEFKNCRLLIAVNNTSSPAIVPVRLRVPKQPQHLFDIEVPAGVSRMVLLSMDHTVLDASH